MWEGKVTQGIGRGDMEMPFDFCLVKIEYHYSEVLYRNIEHKPQHRDNTNVKCYVYVCGMLVCLITEELARTIILDS